MITLKTHNEFHALVDGYVFEAKDSVTLEFDLDAPRVDIFVEGELRAQNMKASSITVSQSMEALNLSSKHIAVQWGLQARDIRAVNLNASHIEARDLNLEGLFTSGGVDARNIHAVHVSAAGVTKATGNILVKDLVADSVVAWKVEADSIFSNHVTQRSEGSKEGLESALEKCLATQVESNRRSGRSTELAKNLVSGDLLVCVSSDHAKCLNKIVAKGVVTAGESTSTIQNLRKKVRGFGGGRYVDHAWVEEYYRNVLAEAQADLNQVLAKWGK